MTFGADEPGQILSQDARGRVLVSRERRQSLLEEYDRRGMSGTSYFAPPRAYTPGNAPVPLFARRRSRL